MCASKQQQKEKAGQRSKSQTNRNHGQVVVIQSDQDSRFEENNLKARRGIGYPSNYDDLTIPSFV